MNDTSILAICLGVFLLLAVFVPYVKEAVGDSDITRNTLPNYATQYGSISGGWANIITVAINFFAFLFWTFGTIHWTVDLLILTPIRLITLWLGIRLARGV